MATANEKERVEFLKSRNNIFRHWLECQGHRCDIEGVALSMDREPPRLAHPSLQASLKVAKEVPARKVKHTGGPLLDLLIVADKLVEKKRAFDDWLESPPAKPKPPAPPPSPASRVPSFDIQDVPKAMDVLGMPMSAKLQRRWFAGYENYSRSRADLLEKEVDQNGVRYAPAMVDDTTIKMEWVLRFPHAKEAFDRLIEEDVRSRDAVDALRNVLTPFKRRGDVLGWKEANADFFEFHGKFQFQRRAVNSSFGQRMRNFLEQGFAAGGVPDDLTGALGSFNFYAAVDYASFDHQRNEATVRHVWIYVRDPYDFMDDQYLGHWSASHVAVVPAHHMAGGKGWLQYPVIHGDVYGKGNVLFPVTNKDYRDWRGRHKQGGDFMIYTDRRAVKLNPPIRVPLL